MHIFLCVSAALAMSDRQIYKYCINLHFKIADAKNSQRAVLTQDKTINLLSLEKGFPPTSHKS